MYIPKHFEETRVEVLHALVRENPLGALVSHGPEGLVADHVPFLVDAAPGPFGTLRAHVARNNPAWRNLQSNPEALVIFRGPAGYISPSYYPTKRNDGRVVPTWNYVAVHASGRARVIEDRGWLLALVTELTTRHESGRAAPWKVTDAPEEYVQQMLGAIVGVEIPIAKLVGKVKASQNRVEADRWGVIEGLRSEGREDEAALVE
jgi:transcriptional regulator